MLEKLTIRGEKNMNANTLADVLKTRGWEVEIRKAEEVADLVDVSPKGLFKCVDGRVSNQTGEAMRGPKVLGGVYAVAAMMGLTTIEGLKQAFAKVKELGFVPCVHSDHHHGAMGCGFFKLWKTGQFEGLAIPEFEADAGKEAVIAEGGVHETLEGDHTEEVVMINLVEGKTLEPNGKRFIVDAWWMEKAGIDSGAYLTRAAETVEKLNGPKKVVIIE